MVVPIYFMLSFKSYFTTKTKRQFAANNFCPFTLVCRFAAASYIKLFVSFFDIPDSI